MKNKDKSSGFAHVVGFLCGCLQSLETTLRNFQSELSTISSDMKKLQEQSIEINQELQNRQQVRGELSQFVDDMVVSQNMIK